MTALLELVAKWRAEAANIKPSWRSNIISTQSASDESEHDALRKCATELEQALAAQPEAQLPEAEVKYRGSLHEGYYTAAQMIAYAQACRITGQGGDGDGWLPIESAPKSGGFLLGVWEGDWQNVRQRFVVYHATGYPLTEGPHWSMRGRYRTEEGGAFELVGWRPLPAPPKDAQQGGRS